MSNIIPVAAELSVGKQKAAYEESIKMYALGVMFGWQSYFFKAAALWNIRENKWHLIEGLEWAAFCEQRLQISARHVNRLLSIGKIVKQYIKEVGEEGPLPYITQKQIATSFEPFFKQYRTLDFNFIYGLSRDFDTFRDFVESDSQTSEGDIKKLIAGYNGKPRPKELAAGGYTSQQTLFGIHDKLVEAGYQYRNGRWEDDEGNEITLDEMGEFVDADAGMLVFTETDSLLDETIEEALKRINRTAIFFSAYRRKHRSPEFKKTVTEKHRELARKVKDLLAIVGAMVDNEEKN